MAKPTLAELKAAYGENYSHVELEPSTVQTTPQSKSGDLDMLRQRPLRNRLASPQKKMSFTKKQKDES